jgi:hypothetical protein
MATRGIPLVRRPSVAERARLVQTDSQGRQPADPGIDHPGHWNYKPLPKSFIRTGFRGYDPPGFLLVQTLRNQRLSWFRHSGSGTHCAHR